MTNPTVRLYLGDCLEFMRGLPAGAVDAVVTDPPYGIGAIWNGGASHGWAVASLATAQRNGWDSQPPNREVFNEVRRVAYTVIIWGGNYFDLPKSRGWLVWNKPERGFTLAEAELAWTNRDTVIRVFDCRRSDVDREHPTQKPLALMRWCVNRVSQPGDTIFDPFMGSGTTGVAAVQLGRNFIGCEIDPGYFAIAKRRIEQALAQPPLLPIEPAPMPEQSELFGDD